MKENPLKKEIPPQIKFIEKIALDIVIRANSGTDQRLSERLSFYAGLPRGLDNGFAFRISGVENETVDIITSFDGEKRTVFTLGWGTTSAFLVNKGAIEDKMITKFRKHEEIKDFDDLVNAVNDFIFIPPKEEEIIDLSRKNKEEIMNRVVEKVDLSKVFENIKRGRNTGENDLQK